jgi:hypothetical protein
MFVRKERIVHTSPTFLVFESLATEIKHASVTRKTVEVDSFFSRGEAGFEHVGEMSVEKWEEK